MKKNISTFILAAALLAPLTACGEEAKVAHTITLTTMAGIPLVDQNIAFMDGNKLVASVSTDEEGFVGVALPNKNLTIKYQSMYSEWTPSITEFKKGETDLEVKVKTAMITSDDIEYKTHYSIGDVVYDFELETACYGEDNKDSKVTTKTMMASEYLEDHDILVLNSWATYCGPCANEFPVINEAYSEMKDDVAFFAFSFYDSAEKVAEYRKKGGTYYNETEGKTYDSSSGYKFDMGSDIDYYNGTTKTQNRSATYAFGSSAVPTTVIVDRYGEVVQKMIGSMLSKDDIEEEWSSYIGEDYDPSDYVAKNKKAYEKEFADYEEGF